MTRPSRTEDSKWKWPIRVAYAALAVFAIWFAIEVYHNHTIEARLAALDPLIRKHAQQSGLSRELIRAVIRAESGADSTAVSGKQAIGLMQVRPDAEADALRITHAPRGNLFDPDYNLLIGTTYLKRLNTRFGGDLYLTMAAYHMGPSRVQEILVAHPGLTGEELVENDANPTTRAYVLKVVAWANRQ